MGQLTTDHLRKLYRTFAEKSIPRMTKEQKDAILQRQYDSEKEKSA